MQIKEISATKLPNIGIRRVAAYARVSSDTVKTTRITDILERF